MSSKSLPEMTKLLASLTEKTRKLRLLKSEMKCGITTDSTKIRGVIQDCYKLLYPNKLDGLDEMDSFLETKNLSIESLRNRNS